MKPIKKFDDVQAYGDYRTLPKGGYVLKIMQVEASSNSYGNLTKVSFDIAEGEYKDFYMQDWKNQTGEDRKWRGTYNLYEILDDGSDADEKRLRKLKTFTTALEESNAGYHWDWDESKWKGLLIGGLFAINQWKGDDGRVRSSVKMIRPTTVECIRTDNYRLPEDQLVDGGNTTGSTIPGVNAFVAVDDSIDEELPFK